MSLAAFLQAVVGLLDGSAVPYMLTGSLASAYYAVPRATQDLDVVIAADERGVERIVQAILERNWYVDPEAAQRAQRARGQFNAIDPGAGWKVDFIVRKDRAFSRVEVQRRQRVSLLDVEVSIASLEDILIAKLEWGRLGPVDVLLTNWLQNLDVMWDEPRLARYLDRLAGFSRVVCFDNRGPGVSDPVPLAEFPTIEQWMDDPRKPPRRRSPRLFVLFVPAGGFAVAALVERGADYRRAWPRVAALGVTLAVLLELAGGAVSYPIIAGSALVNGAAVALGAWLAAQWLPPFSREVRGRDRPLLLLLAYAALILLWSWRPFVPEPSLGALLTQLSPERLVPLRAHGMRFEVFSVVDPLRQFCLAFPVGALLAVWPLRRKGWLAGPLPGVYLTAAVEVGQLFVAGRLFDVTDLLVGVSAVLVGWLVVRRCAFPVHGEVWPARKGAR